MRFDQEVLTHWIRENQIQLNSKIRTLSESQKSDEKEETSHVRDGWWNKRPSADFYTAFEHRKRQYRGDSVAFC